MEPAPPVAPVPRGRQSVAAPRSAMVKFLPARPLPIPQRGGPGPESTSIPSPRFGRRRTAAHDAVSPDGGAFRQ